MFLVCRAEVSEELGGVFVEHGTDGFEFHDEFVFDEGFYLCDTGFFTSEELGFDGGGNLSGVGEVFYAGGAAGFVDGVRNAFRGKLYVAAITFLNEGGLDGFRDVEESGLDCTRYCVHRVEKLQDMVSRRGKVC